MQNREHIAAALDDASRVGRSQGDIDRDSPDRGLSDEKRDRCFRILGAECGIGLDAEAMIRYGVTHSKRHYALLLRSNRAGRNPRMRRSWLLCVLVTSCPSMAGCLTQDPMTLVEANAWSRLKPTRPQVSPDTVEIRYIFIDREEGNELIDQRIWAEADEQIISLETKALLNDNGLRIGKLASRLSPDVKKLLENANGEGEGRLYGSQSGSTLKIQTTDVKPNWTLFTVKESGSRAEELTDAQGYLVLTPTIGESDVVDLSILPEIAFGQPTNNQVPAPDMNGGWRYRGNGRETRSFPEMRISVPVTSGDYLLIGGLNERRGTVGERMFSVDKDGNRRQTVLLVRDVSRRFVRTSLRCS